MQTRFPATDTELFRTYWDDGLLDLLAGVALLVAGAGWATRLGALAVVQAPLWIVMWAPLRRSLVEPRAGYVRFTLARRARNTRKLIFTAALGALLLAFVTIAAQWVRGMDGAGIGELHAALPAAIVATMAVLTAFLTGARRFLGYAALLFLLGTLAVKLDRGPALSLAVAGLVVALSGAVLLARFIRESRDYLERP
ncbi:MAG: hypothetical protein PVJ33_01935 [Lysobacterales bacterium]|jgi:hypothetical protein